MQKKSFFTTSGSMLFLIMGILLVSALIIINRLETTPVNTSSKAAIDSSANMETVPIEKIQGQLIPEVPDLPIYPGAQVEYSYVKRDGTRKGYEAVWESTSTVTTITQWYIKELPLAGWTLISIPEQVATITPPGPINDIEFMITAQKDEILVNIIIENEHEMAKSEITAEFPLR